MSRTAQEPFRAYALSSSKNRFSRLQLSIALLQTSTFQVSNRTTGAAMSPAHKSDVKKHLSRQIRKHILPFQPVSQSDGTGYQRDESNGERVSQICSDPNWDRKFPSAPASIASFPSNEVSVSVPAPGRRPA